MEVGPDAKVHGGLKVSELVRNGAISAVVLKEHQQALVDELLQLYRSLLNTNYNLEYQADLGAADYYSPEGNSYLPLPTLSFKQAWSAITSDIPHPKQENVLKTTLQHYQSAASLPKNLIKLPVIPLLKDTKGQSGLIAQEMATRKALKQSFISGKKPILPAAETITMASPICAAIFADVLTCFHMEKEILPAEKVARFLAHLEVLLPADQHSKLKTLLQPGSFGLLMNQLPQKVVVNPSERNPDLVQTQLKSDSHGRLQYKSLPHSQWIQNIRSTTSVFTQSEKLAVYVIICQNHGRCPFDDATVGTLLSIPGGLLFENLKSYFSAADMTPEEVQALLLSNCDFKTPQDLIQSPTFSRLFSSIATLADGGELDPTDLSEVLEDIESAIPAQAVSPQIMLAEFIFKHFLPTFKRNYNNWWPMFHASDVIGPQHSKALQVIQYVITHLDRNMLNSETKSNIVGPAIKEYVKRSRETQSISTEESQRLRDINPVTANLIINVLEKCNRNILTPAGRTHFTNMRMDANKFPVVEALLQEMIASAFLQFREDLIPIDFLGRSPALEPSSNPTITGVVDFLVRHGIALPKHLSDPDLHKASVAAYTTIVFSDNGSKTYTALASAYSQTAKKMVNSCMSNLRLKLKLGLGDLKIVLAMLAKLPADSNYRALEEIADSSNSSRSTFRYLLQPLVRILVSPASSSHIATQDNSLYWEESREHRFFNLGIDAAMQETSKRVSTEMTVTLAGSCKRYPLSMIEALAQRINGLWSPYRMTLSSSTIIRRPIGKKIHGLWTQGGVSLLSVFALKLLTKEPCASIPPALRQKLCDTGIIARNGSICEEVYRTVSVCFPDNDGMLSIMMLKIKAAYPEFIIPRKYRDILTTHQLLDESGHLVQHCHETLNTIIKIDTLNCNISIHPLPRQDQYLNVLLTPQIKHTSGYEEHKGAAAFRNINSGFVSALCAPHVLALRAWLSRACDAIAEPVCKIDNETVQAFWNSATSAGNLLTETDAYRGAEEHLQAFQGRGSRLGNPVSQVQSFLHTREGDDLAAQHQEHTAPPVDTPPLFGISAPTVATPAAVKDGQFASPEKLIGYLDPEIARPTPPCPPPVEPPGAASIIRKLFG